MTRVALVVLLLALQSASAQIEVRLGDGNAELAALKEADQADRESLDAGTAEWPAVIAADSVRLARTHAVLRGGGARTATDLFNAALVLQHSRLAADHEQAYRLSMRSYTMDGNPEARWLTPRAYDRWQMSSGRPQVYGTQMVGTYAPGADPHDPGAAPTFSLGNADLDAVTDAERTVWGLRPAAEVRATVACMNRRGAAEADFDACRAETRTAAPESE